MTIEPIALPTPYTVAGLGPYTIDWPYISGAVVVQIETDTGFVTLAEEDLTLDPPMATVAGDLYLSAEAAAEYAGSTLWISRNTPVEQGWLGTAPREKSLEAQLDRLAMALQDNGASGSMRVLGSALPPMIPAANRALIWNADATAVVTGPDASEIAAAGANAATATAAAQIATDQANLAIAAAAENLGAFPSRAQVQATNIPIAQQRLFVWHNGLLLAYDRATTGTALTSLDGTIWMPSAVLLSYLEHWGLTTYSSEAAALAAGAAMTSDQRTAQQAALVAAFGETSGELVVKGFVEAFDQITINPARRVRLFSGADFHGICVSSRFNMAAACIVQGGTTAGGGCIVDSLNILCDQSPAMASGLRADLIPYPSAFDCAGDFGAIGFLRIQRSYTAFRAVREDAANNGGWRIGRIEYSSFSDGVKIGTATKGPLHFFAVADLDAWPYAFAGNANLLSIYYDGVGRQAYFGRCDNLTVDRMGVFRGGRVEIDAGNGLPVQIDKLALDGDGAELRLISGKSIVGSIYATEAATSPQLDFKIKCLAGSHRINACDMVGDATPMVEVTGGKLTISGDFYNTNLSVGQIATVTAGQLNMLDSRLAWPDGARAVPAVEQSGTGVLRMVGCSVDPAITTAGVAVKFNTDRAGNYVEHGAFGIHSVTIPAGALVGVYGRQQRIDLAAKCAAGWRAMPGEIIWADGVAYVGSAGATAISDLPGLLPAINVTYPHFGAAGVGGNDTTAIDAAHAYLTTMWATSPGAAGMPVGALRLHIPTGRWRSAAGRIYAVPGTGFTVTGDGPAAQLDQVDFALGGHSRCSFSDFSMRGATAIGLNLSSGSGVNTAKGFYRNIYIRDKTTAGIALNGAQHNKFVSCFAEECGIGLQFLGGAGNNFTNCDFQQCVTYGVDIRSNGELRMNSCRARGTGFGSAAAGGWANLNVYTTGDPILEHYFVDCSFSGAQYGGRRYAIASIADNGSGKIRVTTSVPHELAPGLIDVQLNGTAAYDAGGAIAAVLDVISPTVFDMDRAYTAPAGAVGNVWLEGWDILMVNAGGLGDINDMFFTGGNANYVKLDGVYNFVSNGRIPKQQLWLTDNASNNQIYLQRSARGRSAQTQRDVVPSGPGSHRGWGEVIFGRDNPISFAVDGGERVAMRMPDTGAGVGANNLPAAINESAVMADGLRWRVNGKEATVKDVGGNLVLSGVHGVLPNLRCTVGGTSSAITLTTGANLSGTLPTGIELRFRATAPNPGATTVSVDGGPPVACRTRTGVALPGGYIRADVDTIARFDGTYLVLSREVEQGSNANGEYTRHADGSQTCWTKLVIKPAADATTGIKSATWTFPAAFVSGSTKTVVTHAIQTTNPIQRGQVAVNACTNTDVALLYNEGAGTAVDVTTHATATGRWF